ncbi:LptA/OstA family protein [Roseateles sp. BYS78W]|uniref:LptA/OstA family protein n=1 Tax=Pelomonas candidula TaxID=3299025 RepID=A0ABW7H8W3_9BURK
MRRRFRPSSPKFVVCALCAALGAGPALADRADSTRSVSLSFDDRGLSDLAKGRTEIVGDVVLSQGSTLLRAERADLRETPDGFYRAFASGRPSRQASFRQGRDAPGAAVDGSADQLDYDARAATVHLLGKAYMRVEGARGRMEATGSTITYDNRADVLVVEAGSRSPNPQGRGRILYMPSAVVDASASAALRLNPSLTLGQRD